MEKGNLEENCKTLIEVDKNMQDIKFFFFYISGIIFGMDAQVEVEPHQERFVGGGTRLYQGNRQKICEMESKLETYLVEWISKKKKKRHQVGQHFPWQMEAYKSKNEQA